MQILKDKLHILQVICKDNTEHSLFIFILMEFVPEKDLWRNSIILSWPLDARQEDDYSNIQQTCCRAPGIWNDTSQSLGWSCRSWTEWSQSFTADQTPRN